MGNQRLQQVRLHRSHVLPRQNQLLLLPEEVLIAQILDSAQLLELSLHQLDSPKQLEKPPAAELLVKALYQPQAKSRSRQRRLHLVAQQLAMALACHPWSCSS